jgi:hypothetical protein
MAIPIFAKRGKEVYERSKFEIKNKIKSKQWYGENVGERERAEK